MEMRDDLQTVLLTEQEINDRVKEIAAQISNDYRDGDLVVITVLKGAAPFACDLMKNIDCYLRIDFLVASSYGSGISTSGAVKIVKDIDINIEGKDVLIIDDILDTGITLNYIKDLFATRLPKTLKVCVLLDKPERRIADITPDYCGFSIPNEFVVGYGLDFNQLYRNLPFIGVLKKEKYEV